MYVWQVYNFIHTLSILTHSYEVHLLFVIRENFKNWIFDITRYFNDDAISVMSRTIFNSTTSVHLPTH